MAEPRAEGPADAGADTTADAGADATTEAMAVRVVSGPARLLWIAAGLVCVGLGGLGIVLPGLPTTGFFVAAVWFFARSSPRLEAWVLGLPGVGQLVRDHRDGLGMPRRAKVLAISMIVFAVTLSVVVGIEVAWVRVVVAAAGVVGVYWVLYRVPTRESVLAAREQD